MLGKGKSIKTPETYIKEEIICFSSQARIYISLLLEYFHEKRIIISRCENDTRNNYSKNKFLSGGEARPER